MDLLYDSSSWVFYSLLVVAPSILISLALLRFVRKRISHQVLKKNHDVAGFTLSIVGVLYSVILGFTVINTQTRYSEVLQTIHLEALTLADLYRDASFFPPKSKEEIRASLRNYVDYVVQKEWQSSRKEKRHIASQSIMEQIWKSYYNVELTSEKTDIWYTASVDKLNALMNARLTRQFHSWNHLGPMMWSLLIVGALITVGVMFFFGLENLRSQMIMTALVVGYISFMLYLVYSLDHVFTGPGGIKPVALEEVAGLFDGWDGKKNF